MNKLLVIILLTTPLVCFGQSDLQALYDSARVNCDIELAKQVNELAKREKNSRVEANSLFLIALCQKRNDNLYEAVLNYMSALKIYRKEEHIKEVADILENLGNIYNLSGYKDMAMEYYSEALTLRHQLEDSADIAKAHNYLANAYLDIKDFDNAAKHCELALDIAQKVNAKEMLTSIYDTKGIVHRNKGEFDLALASYQQSLNHATKKADIARIHNNRGYALWQMGDLKGGQQDFNAVLHMISNDPNNSTAAFALGNLAATYESYRPDSAKIFYKESLKYFNKHQLIQSTPYFNSVKALKDIAKTEGNLDEYVYYSDKIDQLTEQLLAVRSDLKNLYQQYQVEAATYKYDSHQKAQALERQLIIDRYITIALVVLVLVMAVMMVMLYRKNRKITFAQETARKIYQVINS
ncbi:hypothetical protein C900_02115 [Fulvivirga imtechensis AK7]|uniref:Uncharacterized protein n=1 Tax=Fulvivirga imtechensis AK7 TaxID=1237149 RepID=L8JXB7_9BACT|nr:tetratricopeptide repeat protein [Fulvivirga imtechensis]ELR73711.1 hypothetical protein C900_02115 [Fulvivirga imtechensis AK7]